MSRMVMVMAVGACALVTGCATAPCGPACGGGCGPLRLGRHCDDCVPPWVPCCRYKPCCDNLVTRHTARDCGRHALRDYQQGAGRVSCHFADGFVQAYVDLAENRAPQPPSVPPSRYWTAYYRSCAGRPAVEEWYAGYQAGLEIGSQSGVSRFNRIDVWTCGGTMTRGL